MKLIWLIPIALILLIIVIIIAIAKNNNEDTKTGRAINTTIKETQAKIAYKLNTSQSYSINEIPDIEVKEKIGIYMISIGQDFWYIGQSKDIRSRWMSHRRCILDNKPGKLYDKINTFLIINDKSINQILFTVLEECLESELTERENFWMNEYGAQEIGANTADSKKREAVVIRTEGNTKLLNILQQYSKPKTIIINLELSGLILEKGGGEFRKEGINSVKKFKKNDFLFSKTNEINKKDINIGENGDIHFKETPIEILSLPSDTLLELERLSKKELNNE